MNGLNEQPQDHKSPIDSIEQTETKWRQQLRSKINQRFASLIKNSHYLENPPSFLNVCIFGFPGSGKSALMNLVNYATIYDPATYCPLPMAPVSAHGSPRVTQQDVIQFSDQVTKQMTPLFRMNDLRGADKVFDQMLNNLRQLAMGEFPRNWRPNSQNKRTLIAAPMDAVIFLISAKPLADDETITSHPDWTTMINLIRYYRENDEAQRFSRPFIVVMTHCKALSAQNLETELRRHIPRGMLLTIDNTFDETGLTENLSLDVGALFEKLINAYGVGAKEYSWLDRCSEWIYFRWLDIVNAPFLSAGWALFLLLLLFVIFIWIEL